ncbi:LysR family transcriptional regulator [Ruegeria sediminis]|uniref:LysR family transcriptional regulator n=1 Tax=Ruegeria sediminis TaxID=2583820 RepID=A0ABY2WT78_9RHOB|nr:LysR family transcriptional regulator [Ruegeria sediminis]TMV03389.1 LysR family transcriptional regulator [Ruegeria sediminis]
MDKLSVMNAFCRIVERGSFARAAEDLGVSAALLSREVKLLEKSLGCTLLTRTTRSMSLTDHGRLYYEMALGVLGDVDQIENRIRRRSGVVKGHLRINAPVSFGQVVLAPLLPGFLEAHPELEVTLSLDDRVVDMIEGGFDLSIRVKAELPDSALVARPVGDVRQRVFAAPTYLERKGTPQSPDDLGNHAIIGFLLADHKAQWQLLGPQDSRTIEIAPRVRVGNSLVLRDLLVAGEGIGTLPDFIADGAVARGDLVPVLPDWELPRRHIYAVTASRLGADAKVNAFLDHLRAALGGGHS